MNTPKSERLNRLTNALGSLREMLERDAEKIRPKDVEKVKREVPEKLKGINPAAIEREAGALGELLRRVRALYAMIFDRSYKVQPKTKLLSVAALLYFVLPTDLVPDFIPGIGLIDDALVLRALWGIVSNEVDRYTSLARRPLDAPPSSPPTPAP